MVAKAAKAAKAAMGVTQVNKSSVRPVAVAAATLALTPALALVSGAMETSIDAIVAKGLKPSRRLALTVVLVVMAVWVRATTKLLLLAPMA